jgi:hypothetical protein
MLLAGYALLGETFFLMQVDPFYECVATHWRVYVGLLDAALSFGGTLRDTARFTYTSR